VPISAEWSPLAKIGIHAASLLSGRAYTFYEYGNSQFGRELNAARRASPDLVHIDSMDLYRWLPLLPQVPIACTHHNVESDLLRLRARHIRGRAIGAYIRHQASEVEKVERELCPRFATNVMTSNLDAERLRALAKGARTDVVPNGVDINYFQQTPNEEIVPGRVVFLGPTYMFPNLDAVEFFLSSAWPAIKQNCPHATLDVIGKNRQGDKERFESHPGVTVHGYVPDIRPYFARAECSVVPLRVGGGTRLKVLDAWSMGKPVISTSIGCEGLDTVDGENILIRDNPGKFASAVVRLLSDDALRNRLRHAGRRTAEAVYAWPVIGEKLRGLYGDLLDSSAGRR
jgi:polysaccharide biosynthesis protein PslH